MIGGLLGLGVPDQDARHFDRGFRAGGVIVTVRTEPDRADTASRLLSRHGADLGPSSAAGAARRTDEEHRGLAG